jgi:Ca2+-transporting ATPase
METETGRIANLLKGGEGQTRLERGLNKLGKAISAIVIAISAIIFLFGLVAGSGGVLQNFMTAIAIAVAAIPEGLPAVVTIIMAFGVQRMSRRSVIIRRLKSVETLGGCTVICTDKTGTLTENKLKVERWESFDEKTSRRALECMLCCSTVKGEKGAYIGDPTEIALRIYADEQGFEGDFTLIDMVPFSSDRKLMSVAANFGGKSLIYVKGGADVLIERCTKIVKGGRVCSLTHEDRQRIIDKNNEMSDESLRVLALACRKYDGQILEYGLTFLGLAGLADGIKPKVKDAVASCKAAGITTKMITGDHVRTAFAIAKKIGIAESFDEVVSGSDLDSLNEEERKRAIVHGKVFARVSPKHKSIIVKTLQSEGEVVAMTGDGVNDAPSIKSADIGIAMGRGGTEVAKSAADMVIADDNFSTIVSAIREGRRISANISKTICFFLSTNLAEVLSILIATLILFKFNFLTSTQLLWLNLITDSFPTLALGVERAERDIMSRPPVPADRVMFSKRSAVFIGVFGAYMTAVTLCAFVACVSLWGNEVATTVTFLTLSFLELFQALNVRSDRDSIFKVGILSNKILLLTLVLGVAVNVVLVITPLAAPFSLVKLSYFQWLLVALLSLSIIPFGELYKLVLNKFVPYICTKSGNKSNKNKGKRYIFNKVNKRA